MLTLSEKSRPNLGNTHPHIHWVLRFSHVVKRPGCAAGRSLSFSAEFKNECSSTSAPTIFRLCGQVKFTLPPHLYPIHDRAECRRNTG